MNSTNIVVVMFFYVFACLSGLLYGIFVYGANQ